jgi:hypothetical protein
VSGTLTSFAWRANLKHSGTGTKGRSEDAQTLVERVIALHDGAIELEFDLPERASPQDRAHIWQFPVRVLKAPGRPLELLNRPELEARLRTWLQNAGMAATACGQWGFTRTAVKIECDPQSVLQIIEPFNLRPGDLHDGTLYTEPGARGSAPLRAERRGSDGTAYIAEMEINPDLLRHMRAEVDVAVAQITSEAPLPLEAALKAREADRISGTIATAFEVDAAGRVTRRRSVSQFEIVGESGSAERETTTITVERRLVSP